MNDALERIERKVAQLAALCDTLRAENHRLHDRAAQLEEEKTALAARMTEARQRLEALAAKLPPTAESAA